MGSKNGSNVKHICLSKNEKSWQTKQEKMIKAQNEARSHALNHSSGPSAIDSLELSAFSIMHLPKRTDLSCC